MPEENKEDREMVPINQMVDGPAYRKIKALAAIKKRPIPELVNIAVIEYANKIKL